MRVQTQFGKIVAGADEKLFGTALVFFRMAFGAYLLFAESGMLADLPRALVVAIGLACILGLLVRPAAAIGMTAIIISSLAFSTFAAFKVSWPVLLFMFSLFGLMLPGGLGNSVGLNGLIMSNVRRQSPLMKFLFG